LPYLLTLPGHAFYWFKLTPEAEAPGWHQLRMPHAELPVHDVFLRNKPDGGLETVKVLIEIHPVVQHPTAAGLH
jgi:hypothetical protein